MFFDYNEVKTLTAQLRTNDDLRFVPNRLLETASLLIKSSSVGEESVTYPLLNLARLSVDRYLEDTYFTYEITHAFRDIWGDKGDIPFTDIAIVLLKCYEHNRLHNAESAVKLFNNLIDRRYGFEVIGQTILTAYIHYSTQDYSTVFRDAHLPLVNTVQATMIKGFTLNPTLTDEKSQITLLLKTLQYTLKYSTNRG